ncbi:AI-2E family transporter [Acrocarpospora corrugata]|uniref:AI-2E family transporter n=1 Tax=Acrocarpospora corrugata TaxID=35763 RepID=A0A5M3VS72_9ACTN|nr:AI-2E family transporter [Acrocarpospora corrugata]GER99363.1 AI-2E family transporter [Acrocarpospora corrugata]
MKSPEEKPPASPNLEAGKPAPGTVERAVETAVATSSEERPFGKRGRPFDRRSPFFVGMTAAAGVATTYGVILLLGAARDVLILIGLGLFLAIGLEPAAAWLVRRGLPRWASVLLIVTLTLGLVAGFLALAIPAILTQGAQFAHEAPTYLKEATSQRTFLGKLNERFELARHIQQLGTGERGLSLVGGVLGAGKVVAGAAASLVIVLVLTVYFLADMPRIKATVYRCVPNSRRPRAILMADDILGKVGMFVLGNLATSLVAGVLTFVWLEIFRVPYALLLALFVALMDLVPVVGSTIAGIAVALVALSVSLPVALATVGFVLVYRVFEDYVLVPRVMGKAVEVPGVVTLIAVTVGATLLGIVGALIAIPVAAALGLILREVAFPRLDDS